MYIILLHIHVNILKSQSFIQRGRGLPHKFQTKFNGFKLNPEEQCFSNKQTYEIMEVMYVPLDSVYDIILRPINLR